MKNYQNLTDSEKVEFIKSSEFAYARFKPSGLGDYYSLYRKDSSSPTGVLLAFGLEVEEWERLSEQANRANQYLAPNEKF